MAAMAVQAAGEYYLGWGGTLVGGGTARVRVLGVLVAMTVIFLVGLVDDLMTLSPGFKLLGQVVAAAIAIASGLEDRLRGQPVRAAGLVSLGLLAAPVTLVYIVGVHQRHQPDRRPGRARGRCDRASRP